MTPRQKANQLARVRWPALACERCSRLGRRDRFVCEMAGCPATLIKVNSATEYLRLGRSEAVPELEQPKKPKTKPKRRRPRGVESEQLSRPEISRIGRDRTLGEVARKTSGKRKQKWLVGK